MLAIDQCPHNPKHPARAAAAPGHSPLSQINADTLTSAITGFLDTRVFGPDRAALLAASLPAARADAAAGHAEKITTLNARLGEIRHPSARP